MSFIRFKGIVFLLGNAVMHVAVSKSIVGTVNFAVFSFPSHTFIGVLSNSTSVNSSDWLKRHQLYNNCLVVYQIK